ncbi:hypothetical protein [Rhizobium chutanense]|uniref:Uncharacterized protein n=1 Tax=Rhizobium chutanense TaxID=2035448 RepID=A0A2A6J5P8_9HYPH|nr:hypothetical protein [Rhizobium chutanense]PDT01638.1 hypothetical protein CO666_24440 [Rhizobium chutanense]RUM01172.1 hypothetical protein EFR84_23230 [Rhizobium chutanense]
MKSVDTQIRFSPMRVVEVLDEKTASYSVSAQPCFESLHGAANRMAGLLVLLAITKSRHVLDMDVHRAAAALVKAGNDEFRGLVPTPRSRHFHRHLGKAGGLLAIALRDIDSTLSGSAGARDPLAPLRAGWEELRSASICLPGFEVVDFEHSCCALHQTAN